MGELPYKDAHVLGVRYPYGMRWARLCLQPTSLPHVHPNGFFSQQCKLYVKFIYFIVVILFTGFCVNKNRAPSLLVTGWSRLTVRPGGALKADIPRTIL